VTLLQVDIDFSAKSKEFDVEIPDSRVWIEAVKHGQVVGILEACLGIDGLPTSVLDELEAMFSGSPISQFEYLPDELLPRASVVVPTICRTPDQLILTVESLLASDYPDFEIIIVDNRPGESNDPLPELPGGERVHVATEPVRGISAARNRGISLSTGDFVAFTDDDAMVEMNWLRALGTTFALDSEVDAIGGLVLPEELATEPQLWFEEFYGGFSRSFHAEKMSLERLKGTDALFPYAPGRFGAGCNMAFRRSTLDRVGGFDIVLGTGTLARGGEDLAMFLELLVAGGTVAFEPAAMVRHSHRRTERDFLRQVFSYGTGLTAMYTAIVVRNPTHLAGLLRRIPAGLRLLTRPRGDRSPSRTPSYPSRTILYQVLGMFYGPLAYVRSRRKYRWLAK
jgi:GT2 family glycosyltransferase